MSRTFAYCRVSTNEQTTENQLAEIEAAGFRVEPRRAICETISGSVPALQRSGFKKLVDKLDWDDVLIVTKLDRLGRNAIDVRTTVELLASQNVRVHCLALGGVDLTSAAGKMTMSVINAVAEFERDLLVERTQAGLRRAKAEGQKLGRPRAMTDEQEQEAISLRQAGASLASVAAKMGVSRSAIQRAEQRANR
ncbi:recombinase family protein [Pelagerythrobacter rhizovicinus]|uniref:Recombinase family protein n=1 Tax=Pelagerythrobacter rhizovicinus TaxID=2268576 RepID=A0A4Q2KM55_9SPHN|nr:recombinase family protein [Pelagerythrobacter rhizovicinus]RXZ64241.1 recombinase family protein [Pelagerythrobacter rhizovicinus]